MTIFNLLYSTMVINQVICKFLINSLHFERKGREFILTSNKHHIFSLLQFQILDESCKNEEWHIKSSERGRSISGAPWKWTWKSLKSTKLFSANNFKDNNGQINNNYPYYCDLACCLTNANGLCSMYSQNDKLIQLCVEKSPKFHKLTDQRIQKEGCPCLRKLNVPFSLSTRWINDKLLQILLHFRLGIVGKDKWELASVGTVLMVVNWLRVSFHVGRSPTRF